ncbi:uncharacterized protein LOC128608266 [Ictalurus furcatus]|uniref:uncharacterized protein LOC128608266 n=1 Tax=Ictalurus furcatus TaxID=66913 RepID=UPI0023501F7B|nr:uncharacterized protein LOC128608266 [Ictalurus furcatus]
MASERLRKPKSSPSTTSHDDKLPLDFENLRNTLIAELTSTIAVQVKAAIDSALAPVVASFESFKSVTESQGRRIDELDQHLNDYSDRIVALEQTVLKLISANKQLSEKVEDLESRSRRCTLRVIGIPEREEGSDLVTFMSKFFQDVLGSEIFPTAPLLDRAHRIGPVPSEEQRENQRSRVVIVRFHYFHDREKVVRRGNWNQLFHQGRKVFIFPDFSSSVAKRRAAFAATMLL